MFKFLTFLLLVSCGSIHVNQDYKEKSDFSNLKYYRIVENKNASEDSLIRSRVVKAVNRNLMAKGFMPVKNGKADFDVDYQYEKPPYERTAGVATGVGVGLGLGSSSAAGVGFGSGHRVMIEKLTIRMLKPGSDTILWKGSVNERLVADNPSETTKNFDESIKAIIDKFPPK